MTARTSEYSDIQGHDLSMSTDAACLTRIGWIDFDKLSASFFRFVRELAKEGRPRSIGNAFCKTMIVNHAVHMQIFHADRTEMVNDLATLLMGEVISTELGTLMDTRYYLAVLVSLWGILGQFTMLALHFGKSL